MAKNKSEFKYIQGKVSWFRSDVPNNWNKYACQIHPDAKSLEIIRDLQAQGLKNQLKKDEDGYFVNFSRPVTKTFDTGKIITFTPVEVFDKEGNPYYGTVGNGSDATLKIEVYEHKTPGGGTAVAARWVSARIDNLVPFNPGTDLTAREAEAAQGLNEQPKQWE
jgi:hypothetical protein